MQDNLKLAPEQTRDPLNVADAVARLAADPAQRHDAKTNGAHGNGRDPGAQNIAIAGELASQALADCNEELAKRAIAFGEAEVEHAKKFKAHCYALGDKAEADAAEFKAGCQAFAADKRAEGKQSLEEIEQFFATRKKLASGLAALRDVAEPPPTPAEA